MKDIRYKKRHSIKRRRKMIAIDERCEDKDCKTHVHKSFIYIVEHVAQIQKEGSVPEIFITKTFDSRLQQERFNFKVKGAFFMTQDRYILKVNFCHNLRIEIDWKNKIFSPNKSATLT